MTEIPYTEKMRQTLHLGLPARLAILGVAFLGEKIVLGMFVDFDSAQKAQGFGAVVRFVQHSGFRFLVALAATITVYALVQDPTKPSFAGAKGAAPIRAGWVASHILLIIALAPISYLLYRDGTSATAFAVLISTGIVLGLGAALSAFAAMAPLSKWIRAARELGIAWIYAIAAALLSTSLLQSIHRLWAPTSAFTFKMVEWVLMPLLPNLHADNSLLLIGTDRFAVLISEECSGLEGIGLMLTLCAAWLIYFRRDYLFPRALLLIPIGVLVVYLLNVVRIAALLLIGHGGFPAIAAYGFHSQAGWMLFNAAAGGLVFFSRQNAWLYRTPARGTAQSTTVNPTAFYVIPLLAVLFAGSLAHALASDFERLYPIRLVAGLSALVFYRRKLATLDWRWGWHGLLTGVLIFAFWIAAVRWLTSPASMPVKLVAMSTTFRCIWIASRVATSVLIVPIVEELAYHGFLMRRVVSRDFESVDYRSVSWSALTIAAIAFGLPHGSMSFPATAAGIAYGYIVKRRGSLAEAIVAHATTNLLIVASVLGWNQWQLW